MQNQVCRSAAETRRSDPSGGRASGFADVHLTGAAAVGGGRDDVLRGGRLAGRLRLQLFARSLGCVLGLHRLFGLQLGLTVRDHVVRLQGPRRELYRTLPTPSATMSNDEKYENLTLHLGDAI